MQIETSITPTMKVFEGDNGWAVYAVTAREEDKGKISYNKYGNFTVSGDNIPELTIGNSYDVVIEEDKKSKYPSSYKVVKFGEVKIETVLEQWLYLQAIVTENQFNNIKDKYNISEDKIIDIIRDGSFEYKDVKGFGEATYNTLVNKVDRNIEISKALAFFSQYGVSAKSISSIVEHYGSAEIAISKTKENPYVLLKLSGFGFKRVDEIAMNMCIDKNSPFRIESCFTHVIEEEMSSGNTWIDKKGMIDKSVGLLEIDREFVEEILFKEMEDVIEVEDRYTLKYVYETERQVAKEILERNAMTEYTRTSQSNFAEEAIRIFEEKNGIEITDEQRAFVREFEESNVSFLVGNAGSGKSLLQKMIIEYAKITNKSVLLLAPTGRASKVLTGYTGQQAYTIHKKIITKKPISDDIIVVDEASMCDIFIVKDLFSYVKSDAKVVFIGDDAQIPSVGAGNFLYDCINSGVIKVNRLTKVFRQKEGGILDIATKTRNGEKFVNSGYVGRRVFGKNCVLQATFSDIKVKVLDAYKKLYTSKKWALEDIVVLTPTNKGELGTISINKGIQQIVNPKSVMKREHKIGETIFREGDLVMNTVNKYDIEMWENEEDYGFEEPKTTDVFNGESGVIVSVNNDEKYILVNIEGSIIKYSFEDIASNLIHGWCITTHKSQGGQYKIVISIVDSSATYQLNANLLYTSFSRAKEYMLIIGQSKTINIALTKFANLKRKCFLQEILQKEYLQMNKNVLQ